MSFATIKSIHLATVAITIGFFLLRYFWMLIGSGWLRRTWVRVLPHVNDTVLLASGLTLAVLTRQAGAPTGWLAAKLVALVVYIGLGMVALKRGKTKGVRIAAGVAALAVLGYILMVARTRMPLPFLS